MEEEKRKREDDEAAATVKRSKVQGEDDEGDGKSLENIDSLPEDKEVDEFFAILRRIHVAVKYFQGRRNRCVKNIDGDGEDLRDKSSSSSSCTWTPLFQREDFEMGGVKKGPEKGVPEDDDQNAADLDLNTDPTSDVSNSG